MKKIFKYVLGSCMQLKSEYMMHFFVVVVVVIAGNHDNYGEVKVIIFFTIQQTPSNAHTKESPSFAYQSKERKGFFFAVCHTSIVRDRKHQDRTCFFPTKTHAKDKRNPFSFKKVRGIHSKKVIN